MRRLGLSILVVWLGLLGPGAGMVRAQDGGGAERRVSRTYRVSPSNVESIQKLLVRVLGTTIIETSADGTIIVEEVPGRLVAVEQLIRSHDKRPAELDLEVELQAGREPAAGSQLWELVHVGPARTVGRVRAAVRDGEWAGATWGEPGTEGWLKLGVRAWSHHDGRVTAWLSIHGEIPSSVRGTLLAGSVETALTLRDGHTRHLAVSGSPTLASEAGGEELLVFSVTADVRSTLQIDREDLTPLVVGPERSPPGR